METTLLNGTTQLNSLKNWLVKMQQKGEPKYYEILVDGMRIVDKTDNLEAFDEYEKWMDGLVQSLRVMVYNTQNSHRARVFEMRTAQYVDGKSEKLYHPRKRGLSEDEIEQRVQAIIEDQNRQARSERLQEENQGLKKQVTDAESYIDRLEREVTELKKRDDFDLASVIKSFLPDKKDKTRNKAETTAGQETDLGETDNNINHTEGNVNTDVLKMVHNASKTVDAELYEKINEMYQFLVENPETIDSAYDALMQFKALKQVG